MGLAIRTTPIIEWRLPQKIAECRLLLRGFDVSLPFYGVHTRVEFYKGNPDFPPTPKNPEQWRIGFIQNAIKQTMDITWLESGGEVTKKWTHAKPMLDASPGKQLPFYSPTTVFFPGTAKQDVHIHSWDIEYGGSKGAGLWGGGPAERKIDTDDPWSGLPYQTYDIELIDTPHNFIWSFHNDDRDEPLLEFKRTLTLQFWVAAVPVASIADSSKYYILGQSNQFTLSSVFRRRNNHDLTCAMDAFDVSVDTDVAPNVAFNNVVGPNQAKALRPVIGGDLSNKPAISFLETVGFVPKVKPPAKKN